MTENLQPESEDQLPVNVEDLSPLRSLVTEVHEIYDELLYVGFEEQKADRIVAFMLLNAIEYRGSYDEDEDDEEDDDTGSEWSGES